jgi:hypothetical protein
MPQVRFMDNGTLRTATRIRIMDNGTLRTVQRIRAMVSGVLQTVYQFFTTAPSAANVYGSVLSGAGTPIDITTNLVSAVVSGGVGPFTYLWTRTDAGPDTWTINSSTSSSTSFTATGVDAGTSAYATFTCTVTDTSSGATATFAASVAAQAQYTYVP